MLKRNPILRNVVIFSVVAFMLCVVGVISFFGGAIWSYIKAIPVGYAISCSVSSFATALILGVIERVFIGKNNDSDPNSSEETDDDPDSKENDNYYYDDDNGKKISSAVTPRKR